VELRNFRRGRHLYSAGRPSCWALAHILVFSCFMRLNDACAGVVGRHMSPKKSPLPVGPGRMGLQCKRAKPIEMPFGGADLYGLKNNVLVQGRNHWGVGGRTPHPKKNGRTTPTFYVAADCSARNWVYHPCFVLYNNLDQGIGPPTLKTWLRPCIS